MSRYKWVHHEGTTLYEVGILPDGTLYNPRGYPDDIVRTAVLAADARKHERRSRAATKAADTLRQRQSRKVYAAARRLTLNNEPIGPRHHCVICGRKLNDAQSIAGGIGSECWQSVLNQIRDSNLSRKVN